ncbi:hypothetical protein MRB53_038506 [Persea americana]|nr:hypothetical protein MRB53_038506 [Persea americana]
MVHLSASSEPSDRRDLARDGHKKSHRVNDEQGKAPSASRARRAHLAKTGQAHLRGGLGSVCRRMKAVVFASSEASCIHTARTIRPTGTKSINVTTGVTSATAKLLIERRKQHEPHEITRKNTESTKWHRRLISYLYLHNRRSSRPLRLRAITAEGDQRKRGPTRSAQKGTNCALLHEVLRAYHVEAMASASLQLQDWREEMQAFVSPSETSAAAS